jgi:hypothetical protein
MKPRQPRVTDDVVTRAQVVRLLYALQHDGEATLWARSTIPPEQLIRWCEALSLREPPPADSMTAA